MKTLSELKQQAAKNIIDIGRFSIEDIEKYSDQRTRIGNFTVSLIIFREGGSLYRILMVANEKGYEKHECDQFLTETGFTLKTTIIADLFKPPGNSKIIVGVFTQELELLH